MTDVPESVDDFVTFLNLDPASTTTDCNAIELWLKENKFEYTHGDGPGGSTVFKVKKSEYARVVDLYAAAHNTSDYILRDYNARKAQKR